MRGVQCNYIGDVRANCSERVLTVYFLRHSNGEVPSSYEGDGVMTPPALRATSPDDGGGKRIVYGHAPAAWLWTSVSAQAEQALL